MRIARFSPVTVFCAIVILVVGGLGLFRCGLLGNPWSGFERETLNPGFRSDFNPGNLGVPYQRVVITSGTRRLDAFLVPARSDCDRKAAVLIYHGRNETIADWVAAQRRWRDACVTSMAFDYSGHGRSEGPGTIANLNQDAMAAYQEFVRRVPGGRHCLFSHSMGGAPMLTAAVDPGTRVDCIVLASPFSSLVSMAIGGGLPRAFGALMPDVWDNAARVGRVRAPILWIHSRSDQTIPIAEGEKVFVAAPSDKLRLTVDGFDHNAIYKELPEVIWQPMAAFVRGDAVSMK